MQDASAGLTPILEQVLTDWEATLVAQTGPALADLAGLFSSSVGGGKMLRGALVKLGYELTGSAENADVYQAAAAYELLHTGFLIHDDIMDNSELRRGRPAVYVAAGEGHYGLSQAICLADAGFFLAHNLLARSHFAPDRTAAAVARFSKIALDTAAGQMLDLKLSRPGAGRLEADVMRIHELKTAAYTITGPLTVGAILGGATGELLQAIEGFGRPVGTAFQIQDDILGVFASEDVIGKSAVSDISENKNTLLIAYALENAESKDQELLAELYGRPNITAAQVGEVRRIFTESGALEHSRDMAREASAAGVSAAAAIPAHEAHRALLAGLAEYSVSRAF